MSGNVMALFPLIIPVVGSLIIYFIPGNRQWTRQLAVFLVVLINVIVVWSLFFSILAGRVITLQVVRLLPALSIYLDLDPLGMVFGLTASTLWLLAVVYASGYMSGKQNQRQFYFWYVISMSAVMGIAFAGNLFTFYIFFEFLTLATYPLVIQEGSKKAYEAGQKYIVYCLSGGASVLLAFLILQGIIPEVPFVRGGILSTAVADLEVLIVLLVLLIAGFGTKAAVLPLHSWLPAAMEAPVPVSALFHAVAVVKSGVFGIVRTLYYVFNPGLLLELDPYHLLPVVFSITIIVASIMALRQNVLKLRLAYSTISQLGYISLGALFFSATGLLGGVVHLINHAFLKIILFFCAGIIIKETGISKVDEMTGIGKRMPLTMLCFAVAGLGLIGILPINGYISKLFILQGSLEADKPVFVLVILGSALLNSLYYLPPIFNAFFREGVFTASTGSEAPKTMLVPTVMLAFMCIFLGLFAHKTTIPLVQMVVDQVF